MIYFFNSVRPKALVRAFLGSLFLFAMLYFVLKFEMWLIPVMASAIFILVLIYYSGYVRVIKDGKETSLLVNRFKSRHIVRGPLHADMWWSYQFEIQDSLTEVQSFGTNGNDLYVFLRLKSGEANALLFTEYIGFDSRFPNECAHAVHDIGEYPRIPVQRADKLRESLEKAGALEQDN